MKTRMILTALMALTIFNSCEKIKGKGEIISETRNAANYNSIDLAMSATVHFTQAPGYSLTISGQENILDHVITQVEGNRLVIRVRSGSILGHHDPVHVYVSAPGVTSLEVSGSGDMVSDSAWSQDELSVRISGSGNITIASVLSGHLTASISGSGSIRASGGNSDQEELKISGSGTIDLRLVESATVYTTTSGSGETYVNATGLLDVTISGSGNVWYYGTPSINTRVSGSGNLNKL